MADPPQWRRYPAQDRRSFQRGYTGYTEVTWKEHRATWGRDLSADDPGAKTGVGGRTPALGIPGIGRNAIDQVTYGIISELRSERQRLSRARRASEAEATNQSRINA
jgi:hypothetical protein